ncbi:excalibur calcium-binding domain-containing protein [Bacillus sp. NPDC094077]|uniref:excalibur calcium-binding domain-containing protein n=1 Tax=Bacillus sp. NPDC094077 TaxID=3390932 RepID=UPI003D04F965
MKKLLASLFAFVLLFTGYNSSAYAAKSTNDTKNCGDFKSQKEAQAFWDQNGYGVGNDPHRLDNDKDGIPCEDFKYKPVDTTATTKDNEQVTKEEEAKKKAEEAAKVQAEQDAKKKAEEAKGKQEVKKDPVKQEAKKDATVQGKKQDVTKKNVTKETKKVVTATKKQGEKLPNTASNGVTMMLASLGLVLVGSVLMFRRKKTNA